MCNNALYPHPVSYFQLRLGGVVACSDLIVSIVPLSDHIHYVVVYTMSAGCVYRAEVGGHY